MIEVRSAQADRRDRQLARVVRRHRDDLRVGGDVQDLSQQFQALRCDRRLARVAQIEEHDVRISTPHQRERLFTGLGGGDLKVREHRLEFAPQRAVVLEDEKLTSLHCRGH